MLSDVSFFLNFLEKQDAPSGVAAQWSICFSKTNENFAPLKFLLKNGVNYGKKNFLQTACYGDCCWFGFF
jgi:hypothetical protein